MTEPAFPIMEDPQVHSIPWAVIAPHASQAQANHDQTLEELARRGGLSCCEAVAVLEDRPWERMNDNIARSRLIQLVTNHGAAHQPPETGWYPCACGAEHDTPECPFGYTNKLRP